MNEITKVSPAPPPRPAMGMVLRPQSFPELVQFAQMAAKSQMVPKDFVGKPENIMLAIQMGSELGLAPMQSLQNIAIVNGRPSVWGDALIGLCRQSEHCHDIREWFEGDGDGLTAFCEATRHGSNPVVQSFSVADAKKAGLWKTEPRTKKQGRDGAYEVDSGPWYSYPRRMLQMRARGFALRDAFPDVLRGLISAEEAADIPRDAPFTGATIEVNAEPVSTPVAATEPTQPRRTVASFLSDLERDFADALASDEPIAAVNVILSRDNLRRALDTFTNGAKAKLDAIIADARAQLGEAYPPADAGDGFPGDAP